MNNLRPSINDNARISLIVSSDGVIAYCNKAAISDLMGQLRWMLDSDAKEHYECHTLMTFNDLEGGRDSAHRNASIRFEDGLEKYFVKRSPNSFGFELTFMTVEDSDFSKLR